MRRERADDPAQALLGGNEEDRFTEFLARLLREKELASRFLRELCDLDPKRGRPEVGTQVVVQDGRPDLVITGPGYLVIVEAKMASWLHHSQLKPYAEFIEQRREADGKLDARLALFGPAARPYDNSRGHQEVRPWSGVRDTAKCLSDVGRQLALPPAGQRSARPEGPGCHAATS